MYGCGIYLSTKLGCACDYRAIRAFATGCWPAAPTDSVYPELLPETIHEAALYDGSAEGLASRLEDIWHMEKPVGFQQELAEILHRYDPINACRAFDERLEQLARGQVLAK
jgi:hypothetical protein